MEGVHVTMYPMMDTLPLEGDQEKVTSLSPAAAWKLTAALKGATKSIE